MKIKPKIDPRLKRALQDKHVKKDLLRLQKNTKRVSFFAYLLNSRNLDSDTPQADVVDWVRDSLAYALKIDIRDISNEKKFFDHKPDSNDIKRQSYHVYTAPRNKN